MIPVLQVVAVVLVAIAMAMALGHALEYPGKLRLTKEHYLAMQPIYYPGFTIGGLVGEAGGILATILLAFALPAGTTAFWLVLAALGCLLAMHAVYWIVTHPVNNFWLKDFKLEGASAGFFSFAAGTRNSSAADWTVLRDRWEYSHVGRAALALLALALLATSLLF